MMGWRDHVLTCGHRHKSGYGILKCPATGTISHAIMVASYKVHDKFAEQKGFPDQNISPSTVTLINPDSKTEKGLIQVFWDTEFAADVLTYMRKKAGR